MCLFWMRTVLFGNHRSTETGRLVPLVIPDHMSRITFMSTYCEIAVSSPPQNIFDDYSTLIQVMSWQQAISLTNVDQDLCLHFVQIMVWCHQKTGHFLNHCWSIPMPSYGVSRPNRGRVTHICVRKVTIIGSDNGLSPGRRQAIILINAEILLIGPLRTNLSEILIEIHAFSFKKMHLKTSSGKWPPSCLGLNVLISSILDNQTLLDALNHIPTGSILPHNLLCNCNEY